MSAQQEKSSRRGRTGGLSVPETITRLEGREELFSSSIFFSASHSFYFILYFITRDAGDAAKNNSLCVSYILFSFQ
jgi:hypothetical protein